MKIIRKTRNTIPASEMEVGQVAQMKIGGHIVRMETWGPRFVHSGAYVNPETQLLPVQTIDTTPKIITPAEMQDGQIGEIVDNGTPYAGAIVVFSRSIDTLIEIGGENYWASAKHRGFKILPLQPGDKIEL